MRRKIHLKNEKHNKGFTLIELLAIITIITLVTGIAGYAIINIISNYKDKSLAIAEQNIKKTAATYVQEKEDIIWSVDTNSPDSREEISCVSILELINEGYFDENILNDEFVKDKEFIIVKRNIDNKTEVGEEFDENNTCSKAFQYIEKPTCTPRTYNTESQTLINLTEEDKDKYIISNTSGNNSGTDAGNYKVKVKPNSNNNYIWKNGRNNEIEVQCTINPVKTEIILDREVQADIINKTKYEFEATPDVSLSPDITAGLTEDEINAEKAKYNFSGKLTAVSSNKEYVTASIDNPTVSIRETRKINLLAIASRKKTTQIKVTFISENSNYTNSNTVFKLAKEGANDVFNVKLDANGGKFPGNKENYNFQILENETYGETLNRAIPTKEGYKFTGWYTEKNGGDKKTAESKVINSDHTLYAGWELKEYQVNLIANKFSTFNQTVSGVTINYDTTNSYLTLNGTQSASIRLLLTSNESFSNGDKYKVTLTHVSGSYTTKDYYRFVTEPKAAGGANLSIRNNLDLIFPSSGSTSSILTISPISANNASSLYNWIWVQSADAITYYNYKVKVVITKVESKTVKYTNTYGDLPVATKYGYQTTGWYNTEVNGTKITKDTVVTTASDHNLYSQWTLKNVKVIFNDPSGTNTAKESTYTYGVNNQAFNSGFTRTGYTPEGWSTTDGGDKKYEFTNGVSNDWINQNGGKTVNLYVKWKLNTYTVTYDANGGTNAPSNQTKEYGTDLTLSSTNPTKTGYTFTGWNTNKNGTGDKYASGATYSKNEELTLYAVWNINKVNVKFNSNDGTIGSSNNSHITAGTGGYVLNDGSEIVKTYKYGETGIDLPGYNNTNYINITKAGYSAVPKAQWKTSDGGKTFDQSREDYQASDLCDASKSNCTITLYVNWEDIPKIRWGNRSSKWGSTCTGGIEPVTYYSGGSKNISYCDINSGIDRLEAKVYVKKRSGTALRCGNTWVSFNSNQDVCAVSTEDGYEWWRAYRVVDNKGVASKIICSYHMGTGTITTVTGDRDSCTVRGHTFNK